MTTQRKPWKQSWQETRASLRHWRSLKPKLPKAPRMHLVGPSRGLSTAATQVEIDGSPTLSLLAKRFDDQDALSIFVMLSKLARISDNRWTSIATVFSWFLIALGASIRDIVMFGYGQAVYNTGAPIFYGQIWLYLLLPLYAGYLLYNARLFPPLPNPLIILECYYAILYLDKTYSEWPRFPDKRVLKQLDRAARRIERAPFYLSRRSSRDMHTTLATLAVPRAAYVRRLKLWALLPTPLSHGDLLNELSGIIWACAVTGWETLPAADVTFSKTLSRIQRAGLWLLLGLSVVGIAAVVTYSSRLGVFGVLISAVVSAIIFNIINKLNISVTSLQQASAVANALSKGLR